MSKTPTTPSNRSTSPSRNVPFDFYFIPNRPNYITNLNVPMKLPKHCRGIQHNAESSIIKLVEDHLKIQAKLKKANKNKTKNKKATTYKPSFTPREHKPTSPTPTFHSTDTTRVIQNIQPISKQLTSTTTTHYTQPIHNNLTSTCTKLHPLVVLLPSISNQTPTTHQHAHAQTHHQLAIIHSNID